MFFHFLKVAWRSLLHYRTQSLISIAGVSVGLLCFGLCMYIVRYIHSANESFPNHGRIYEVQMEADFGTGKKSILGFPAATVPDLEQRALKGVEIYTSVSFNNDRNIGVEGDQGKIFPYQVKAMEVDKNFTDVFSCRFVYGDKQSAFDRPDAVILTRSTAEKIFGTGNPIGQKISGYVDEWRTREGEEASIPYTVTAVIEDISENSTFSFLEKLDMLFYADSKGLLTNKRMQESMDGCRTYALCRAGTDVREINRQIRENNIKYNFFTNDNPVVFSPMGKEYIQKMMFTGISNIVMLVGSLILLTALLNFYVFTIGQFLNRVREFGIRKSLGSDWKHLFGLLFSEMSLMLFLSLLLALCLSEWVYTDNEFRLNDWRCFPLVKSELMLHLFQYFGLLLLVNTAIGIGVVWKVGRMNMQKAIRRSGKRYVRNTILAIQVFVCLLFMGAAAILKMQTDKMSDSIYSTLTEEEKEHIFSVPLQHQYLADYRDIIVDKLKSTARVEDVLETVDEVTAGWVTSLFTSTENQRENGIHQISLIEAGLNFSSFFQIPVKQGNIPQHTGEILVSTSLITQNDSLGIGRYVYDYGRTAYRIAGVIDDYYRTAYVMDPMLFVKVLEPKKNIYCYVKAAPGQKEAVRESIDTVLSEFYPESMPFQIRTFKQEIADRQEFENSISRFITQLAIISLIITLLGIYSAITLDTRRREKEVAIRKINGAGIPVLIWMFGRFYLTILTVTSAIALPLLIYVFGLGLQKYAVSVSLGWTFALGLIGCTALFIGVTIVSRIVRIVRLNPAEVIKNE